MAGRMRQKTANFRLHPPPICLDIYGTLYFILCISVIQLPYFNSFVFSFSRYVIVHSSHARSQSLQKQRKNPNCIYISLFHVVVDVIAVVVMLYHQQFISC